MSCFSTEELFEIVFYPLNFFNWISLISSLLFRYSIFKEHLSLSDIWSPWVLFGGDEENRTPDPLLARQVLSQLSYTPKLGLKVVLSDFFSLSAFAPAFPSFSYENESQLSYTPKGDFYSLMESPALRASSFKIEQYRFKNLWASSLTNDVRIALFLPKKGGDPAAPSDTATLLRLNPNHQPHLRRRPPCG